MNKKDVLYEIKTLDKMILRIFINTDIKLIHDNLSNPSRTQMQIIKYILDNKDKVIYQRDLEDILNLRRATVSGVLKTMEKNNLIKRIMHGRFYEIKLHENAKKLFIKNQKKVDNINNILIKDISSKDLEIFINVLKQMQNNLNNERENI